MKKKYMAMFGVVAILLVAAFAFVGCTPGETGPAGPQGVQGVQGEQGPPGPAGECNCDVVGGTASMTFDSNDIARTWASESVVVRGAGFPEGKVVKVYFASENDDNAILWFKVEANEVGSFRVEVDCLNETTLRDVLMDVTLDDGGFYNLTVNAFVGSTLTATGELSLED